MARTFNLPDLGEGLTEAEIVEWKVAVGEDVALDQEIVEVETAKASVVIPSPFAGLVEVLHAEAGDMVEVGQPLITFADARTDASDQPPPSTDRDLELPSAPAEERVPNLVGYGAAAEGSRRKRHRGTGIAAQPPTAPEAPIRPLVKPPVRKLAKELGVDLRSVTATGPHGSVSREDVQRAASVAPPPGAPSPAPVSVGTGTTIPMRGIRRTIANHMELSHTIPAAAAWLDADASGLQALRRAFREQHPTERITALSILCWLVVEALREVPQLNARYSAEHISVLDEIHLGVGAAPARGLVVPVVRNAHTLSIRQLSAELARLVDGARDNTLTPSELVGSTFTITNFGALGVDGGIPLINHPDVAILGMGALRDRAVVEDGAIVVRPTMNLSLAFDHRVADGVEASRFLTLLSGWTRQPGLLLADRPPQ